MLITQRFSAYLFYQYFPLTLNGIVDVAQWVDRLLHMREFRGLNPTGSNNYTFLVFSCMFSTYVYFKVKKPFAERQQYACLRRALSYH